MGKISLQDLLKKVDDLPALPSVVKRVMELTEDPNSTARDINEVINQDQSMTAKVLRLANSAFYGFPRRISSVTDATIMLGFQTIRSIVIAASVSKLLSQEVEVMHFTWRTVEALPISSYGCSTNCPENKVFQGGGSLHCALLHDIGKVVLNSYVRETYEEVMDKVEKDKVPFSQAEEEILGFNHALVGSKVAENWNLPELVEAIAFHHSRSWPNRSGTYLYSSCGRFYMCDDGHWYRSRRFIIPSFSPGCKLAWFGGTGYLPDYFSAQISWWIRIVFSSLQFFLKMKEA